MITYYNILQNDYIQFISSLFIYRKATDYSD